MKKLGKKNKKTKTLNFRQSVTSYPFYFLPLLFFIPSYFSVATSGQINFTLFCMSFFIVATLSFNAATKVIIKVNDIQILLYKSQKVQTKTLYLEDVDYVCYQKPYVEIYSKFEKKPVLCRIRSKDRSKLAAFLNQKHIHNQLDVDQASVNDWLLLLGKS